VEVSVKRETATKAASLLKDLDEVNIAKARLGIIYRQETTPERFAEALKIAEWALCRLDFNLSLQIEKL